MEGDEQVDLAIVGDGPTATFVARGAIQERAVRGWRSRKLRMLVIGPRRTPGMGAAWDEDCPMMSSNMHRGGLQIKGGLNRSADGFDVESISELFPGKDDDSALQAYVPRSQVGSRLAELFVETVAVAAGHGVQLNHWRTEVATISREPSGFRLLLRDGRTVRAKALVLALGLLSIDRYPHLGGCPGYHADPWNPGSFLDQVSPDQRVAISGMGPTGIDWLLRLRSRSLDQPVLMASRTGLLPAVRPLVMAAASSGLMDQRKITEMGAARSFEPREIDLLIDVILAAAGVTDEHLKDYRAEMHGESRCLMERTLAESDRPQPLFEALKDLDGLAPLIWRYASEEGRAHVMNVWARKHALLSFAVPPANARAVLDALDTGDLRVRGGLTEIRFDGGRFELHFEDSSARETVETADKLINSSGFDGPLESVSNPLVRSLAGGGLLTKAPYGGARMHYRTGEVLDAAGRVVPGLFVGGGSLARSAGYSVNSLTRTSEHGLLTGMACARFIEMFKERRGAPAIPIEWMCEI